jgi:hypothetical protein
MTKAGAFIACAMFTAACGVGDEDDTVPIDPNPLKAVCSSGFKTMGTFEQSAPKVDDNDTPADTTDDIPIEGCFPIGTWTFTAVVDDTIEVPDINDDGVGDRCGENGTTKPEVLPSYVFRVDRISSTDGSGKIDKYFAKCGSEFFDMSDEGARTACSSALGGFQIARLKVTEGGGGECTGNLEIFDSSFKKHWNFHPSQTSNPTPGQTAIAGFGEFTEFEQPQPIGSE